MCRVEFIRSHIFKQIKTKDTEKIFEGLFWRALNWALFCHDFGLMTELFLNLGSR